MRFKIVFLLKIFLQDMTPQTFAYPRLGITDLKSALMVFVSILCYAIKFLIWWSISENAYSTEGIGFRKFRSKISPTDNNSAEEELKKEIK